MAEQTPVVVVDTTTFWPDLAQAGKHWTAVLDKARAGQLTLWVPEVVVRETVRHHRRQAGSAAAELATAMKRVRALGLPAAATPEADYTAAVDVYEAGLRTRLKEAGARILDLPEVSHHELLDRALADRKPFRTKGPDGKDDRGDGYRDALLWHSITEAARQLAEGATLVFVTANTRDFCHQGALASEVRADLPDTLHVLWHKDLWQLLTHQATATRGTAEGQESAPPDTGQESDAAPWAWLREALEQAVADQCRNLAGSDLADDDPDHRGVGLDFDGVLPTAFTGTVSNIEPSLASLRWTLHPDTEPPLAEVTVDAHVDFDGFVDKADYYGQDLDVDVWDHDWNSHMMWVTAEREATLTFHAWVDAEAHDATVELHHARPPAP